MKIIAHKVTYAAASHEITSSEGQVRSATIKINPTARHREIS